ncbi:PSB7 protein, partial [Polyodon spathula]|nr:PSB7 protein [Polyodon spathula]
RNALLEAEFTKLGHSLPAARKTGTTICGVVFKDGVVLGADTRATEGMIVADKNCSKIHYISPNIYCCGAGTAADTEMTTQIISSNLELHALSTGRPSRVATANRMLKQMLFRYQGYIGAALVLGGVDSAGPHLYSIYPHGSTDKLPYVTMGGDAVVSEFIEEHVQLGSCSFVIVPLVVKILWQALEYEAAYGGTQGIWVTELDHCLALRGSGSLAAMAVFEDRYKQDMQEDEAKQLVRDAIAAGIFNDLGSGSNIDLCVITKNNVDYIRPHDEANKKGVRQVYYHVS